LFSGVDLLHARSVLEHAAKSDGDEITSITNDLNLGSLEFKVEEI
jgi:hypothetical protein